MESALVPFGVRYCDQPESSFQACSFNHSDISPSLESYTCRRALIAIFRDCDKSLNSQRSLKAPSAI
jgi:hypothetical protein